MTNSTSSLIASRGIRAFVDGLVSVILPAYLIEQGYSAFQVGALVTATLLGSAILTLTIGLRGFRQTPTRLLLWLTGLMALTGIGFATITWFWGLFIIGAIGTMNPSSGDVSPFLPLEQALLPLTTTDERRTVIFARYAMVASLLSALGSLAAGLPHLIAQALDVSEHTVNRSVFALYAVGGLMLFSIDALGGGFVIQSMLVLWLGHRFDLSTARIVIPRHSLQVPVEQLQTSGIYCATTRATRCCCAGHTSYH